MTIERRDEQAADVRPLDVNASGPARTTAHQTETFTSDPYAVRREGTLRVQQGIYLPVSYTHLRAHETVLHIVCRLLLVKQQPY